MSDLVHRLMVSSTYLDLKAEREVVRDVCLGTDFFPDMMEYDPAKPDQGILESSYEKVDRAHAYLVLISNWRYGRILNVPENPDGRSVTELEFRKAEARGIPIIVFLRADDAPLNGSFDDVAKEVPAKPKLDAFRERARHHSRITDTFTRADDLEAKVTKALARLKPLLAGVKPIERPSTPPADAIPVPPDFYPHPPYIPGYPFQGRVRELELLASWATSPHDPVLVFEAIGGMGKSMVTWEWATTRATAARADWAGRLWYSFYERGADMHDFCVTALAYITRQPRDAFKPKPTWELAEALLEHLRARPFLLVLDGLERVLVAYHRSDAAQVRDEEVDAVTDPLRRPPRDCIRPDDADLLRTLCAAGPSKVLITSRLMPAALVNHGGQPLPGVRHEPLTGLAQPDAAAMLTTAGVRGDPERIGRYLEQNFGCHPLVVGIVGGLVRNHPEAPGDFERWVQAPDGGGAVNLADPGIRQRQTHILHLAFDGLEPNARELMARLGMIANAVPLDVLEALNPARPPPPDPVADPGALDVGADLDVWLLRDDLAKATSKRVRADLERRIRERQTEAIQEHAAEQRAYAAYCAALDAWQHSAPVREASRWLRDALTGLRIRGLLQWDRDSNSYDLHPVVRGYAVSRLDDTARVRAGQHVADYFAARPQPAFADVTDVTDLANPMQVVRALNLAGRVVEAWGVLSYDMRVALCRLERYHDYLALMQPLFPDGWSTPPAGVDDLSVLAGETAIALQQLGFYQEAAAQEVFAIQQEAKSGPSANLSISLRNHSNTRQQLDDWPGKERLVTLAHAVAVAVDDEPEVLWCDMFQILDLTGQGRVTAARNMWDHVAPRLPPAAQRGDRHLEALARYTEVLLLFREGALNDARLHTTLARLHALGQRAHERWTYEIAGAWKQANDRHRDAVVAFAQAIAMAHDVNLRDTESEARRGLSLAQLGRTEEARAAAASAERDPPHAALASLYLALAEPGKARAHALRGYESAWGAGPPYVRHWNLEECRAVLRALNEPEPQLPPYDPAKHRPEPWEDDIRRMLDEHAARQRTRNEKPDSSP